MKLRVRDRILSAVMGLLIVAESAAVLLYLLGLLPDGFVLPAMEGWMRWTLVGVCILLLLLGLCGIAVLFRRRKTKGFVIQRTEYGDMSISMKAMENMVKKCVDSHSELTVNHTRIQHSRDGVSVDIRITLANGVNIPLTVNALQKQVKQYITSCSGIDVDEVRVMVETDTTARLTAPAEAPKLEEVQPIEIPEEPKPVESAAECLCQHKEEPEIYARANAEEQVPPAEDEPDVEEEPSEPEDDTLTEKMDAPETAEESIAEETPETPDEQAAFPAAEAEEEEAQA